MWYIWPKFYFNRSTNQDNQMLCSNIKLISEGHWLTWILHQIQVSLKWLVWSFAYCFQSWRKSVILLPSCKYLLDVMWFSVKNSSYQKGKKKVSFFVYCRFILLVWCERKYLLGLKITNQPGTDSKKQARAPASPDWMAWLCWRCAWGRWLFLFQDHWTPA